MKLFVDSANRGEIRACLARGASGVTTNPSLIAKEPKQDLIGLLAAIVEECRRTVPGDLGEKHPEMIAWPPLSIEVWTQRTPEMLGQAHVIRDKLSYRGLVIKVPIGWAALEVIQRLADEGEAVNCTCVFTEAQALCALAAGAKYVSIFWNRLRDMGGNPADVTRRLRAIVDRDWPTREIIAGSIRSSQDVVDAAMAGAHVVTASAKLLEGMLPHPGTDRAIAQFESEFQQWMIQ